MARTNTGDGRYHEEAGTGSCWTEEELDIKAQLGEGAGDEDVHEGGLDAKVQPVESGPAIEEAGGLDTKAQLDEWAGEEPRKNLEVVSILKPSFMEKLVNVAKAPQDDVETFS